MRLQLTFVLATVGAVIGIGVAPAEQPAAAGWCDDRSAVVILGDSTSTGYGSTGYLGGDTAPYQPTEYGWAARLARQLPGTRWVNLARNGALASDFLPPGVPAVQPRPTGALDPGAVARISAEQPTLVIVAVGANELGTGRHPLLVYQANLIRLLDAIRTAAPTATPLLVHTWEFSYRWGSPGATYYPWAQYGAVMLQQAQLRVGGYLDLTQTMPPAQIGQQVGLYIRDEYGPGAAVHTTDAGHQLQFANYWHQLHRC